MNILTNTSGLPFPNVFRTTLPFTYKTTMSISVGASANHYVRGNDLFDPYPYMGGNQPIGFDQLAAIYQYYTVTACKIKFISSSGMVVPVKLYIFPTIDPASSYLTEYTAQQMPGVKSYVIGGNSADGYVSGYNYARTKDVLLQLSKDEMGVLVSVNTDPAYIWNWQFLVAPMDTTSTTTVQLTVELTYYAEFKGRIVMNES